jgi:hypothetical protein
MAEWTVYCQMHREEREAICKFSITLASNLLYLLRLPYFDETSKFRHWSSFLKSCYRVSSFQLFQPFRGPQVLKLNKESNKIKVDANLLRRCEHRLTYSY